MNGEREAVTLSEAKGRSFRLIRPLRASRPGGASEVGQPHTADDAERICDGGLFGLTVRAVRVML